MEEEEDKDDKKDKMERQHQAAEENKHGGTLTSNVQLETKKDTGNKGAQNQSSVLFQKNSEIQVLEVQNLDENGMTDIQDSIQQKDDGASSAGLSSVNTDTDHPDCWSHPDTAVPSSTEAAILKECMRMKSIEALENEEINDKGNYENRQALKPQSTETLNQNVNTVQLQQPHDSEEMLLQTETLGSQVPESLQRKIAEHHGAPEEKDKKYMTNEESEIEKEQYVSPKKQLKQTTLGDVGKKQTHTCESKQEGSRPLSPRQVNKGQKSVQVPRQTGKENQQREENEKIHNKLHTKRQDLQRAPEANKMQQKKAISEKTKTQIDQKLKTEEKQKIQTKEGKKQPLLQKEETDDSKQAETKKVDKRQQKSPAPAMKKELQNSSLKKSSVHRKEQILPSPKKHAPSQVLPKEKQSNLQKRVNQKGSNAIVTKKNESKGIDQGHTAEGSSLDDQNQPNPSDPQSTKTHSAMQLQEISGGCISTESTGSLFKSVRESGKELLKECIHEGKLIQKPYAGEPEDQNQGTNKPKERKSQQEKKNEIKKQKQQNEVSQPLKQLNKEKLQPVEQGIKIPQKLGQSTKVLIPQKKEEMSAQPAINKQASKADKELREVQKLSKSKNIGSDTMQQQRRAVDENLLNERTLEILANVDKTKEKGKQNRNVQNATVSKNSDTEKSSENIIHSIRRQYQQLCKEESLQHQSLNQSSHAQQATNKGEKLQQKPEVNSDKNKTGSKEQLYQLTQKKTEGYENDKDPGCVGMQGSSCPIYFGVKSYLHNFYDTTSVKNSQLYEEYAEEDDFEYAVDPIKRRGCRKCCQGFWFRAGLWGGINLILVGVITFMVGYLTPQREMVVGQQGDLEILDRSAIVFNHRLELCRLAGLAVFCCGGMVLFVVLFISTLLHVRGHNSENTCCAENVYYGYTAAPLVEPFIVAQAQDFTIPTATGIKIPIVEQIKSVQPISWPEMGTITEGSRVGQMP